MIIEIDSDYLEGKTEEEISKMIVDISKMIVDILKGNLSYPGIIIQGNKKEGENYPCFTEDITKNSFDKMMDSLENTKLQTIDKPEYYDLGKDLNELTREIKETNKYLKEIILETKYKDV